jgi:DNA invertase Pin-like site-specific DNA recombinase
VELWTVRSGRLDLLRAAFEGERSHDESARKAQAVKSGMLRSVRDRGKAHGGPRPYGYRYVDDKNDTGQLVVVREEAIIVQRIFNEYAAGVSMTAIAGACTRTA